MASPAASAYYLAPHAAGPAPRTGTAASTAARPQTIHLRLSHDVVARLTSGQTPSLLLNLDPAESSLVIDGSAHALSRAEETSPHDLYLDARAAAPGDGVAPRFLQHVGSIGCKLSLRQSLASSGTAASRLKERRGEEEAKRDASRAVLLDGTSLLRTRQGSGSAPLRAKRPESGPTSKLRSSLGVLGANRSESAQPGPSAVASRASTPGGGSSLPGSPNVSASLVAGTSSRQARSSAATPLSKQRISEMEGQNEGSPPSLRVRLIQLLAPGPLSRRKIVAHLRAPEAQILKLLSNHAHAPAHLQSATSTSLSSSRKFQGPVNRRTGGKAAASPAAATASAGPGTIYVLADSAYVDARLDWPDYDARTRVQVSDAAEAAFDRLRLPADALPRSHLYPDGRPTEATRTQWELERLAREAVEKMDDGHDLSDEAEEEAEEGALEEGEASSGPDDDRQGRGPQEPVRSRSPGYGAPGLFNSPASNDFDRDDHSASSPQTLKPLKGLGLSGAPASPSASHDTLGLGADLAEDGPDDVSARTRSAQSAGASSKKRKSSSALDRLKKAVKGKGATPVQRARELERAKARKDKEEAFKAASAHALPAKRTEKSATTEPAASPPHGQESLATRTSARQAGETKSQAKHDVSARSYTDSEDEASPAATRGRALSSSSQLQSSVVVSSRGARRPSSSTSPTDAAHLDVRRGERRSGSAEQLRASATGPTRHGVGLGASQSTEPWLDVRNPADWARLRERFTRVYAEYKAGWELIQGEQSALQAELEAAKGGRRDDAPAPAGRESTTPQYMSTAMASHLVPLQQERGATTGYGWRHSPAATTQKGPLSFEEVTITLQRQAELQGQLQRMKTALQESKERMQGAAHQQQAR